ncbi:unnamed protein product [Symbiodinium pilosum]|uniref:Uncharacterized protein n=1 Tax=Symbiodinium pilosum TaxID=2952 RepID=A0A812SZM8_SYMPI|nr:unnamed protein product [Symbiodinium pilosum]
MPRYNLVVCRNSFLPWAMVHVHTDGLQANGTKKVYCGYKAGLPLWSHTETLPAAQRFLEDFAPRQGSSSCWVLEMQGTGCHSVALQRPSRWGAEAARDHKVARFYRASFTTAGFAVALLASALCVAECCAIRLGVEKPGADDASALEEELPMETLSERVRRVQQRWGIFRAFLVQEYEPLSSARDVVDRTGRLSGAA